MRGANRTGELDSEMELIESYVDTTFRKMNRTTREIRYEQKHHKQHSRSKDEEYFEEPQR